MGEVAGTGDGDAKAEPEIVADTVAIAANTGAAMRPGRGGGRRGEKGGR